eukprot:3222651-Prorocentrum_lima.AAC.1
MTSSLVGSEMCIRDSLCSALVQSHQLDLSLAPPPPPPPPLSQSPLPLSCLLYTSDAADDM